MFFVNYVKHYIINIHKISSFDILGSYNFKCKFLKKPQKYPTDDIIDIKYNNIICKDNFQNATINDVIDKNR